MKNKSLVSITDLSKAEYIKILDLAEEFAIKPKQNLLDGCVVATLFFEPSTRTRLSFETAVCQLGGKYIGFTDPNVSSVRKGESLKDTIQTVANYSDLIIMRHPVDGAARYASEVSKVPIINAGDGANQHPTQTLLDLFSIRKTQKTLTGLKIGFVGDLKYGRTVHSLMQALSQFNSQFYFISPEELKMPSSYKHYLEEKKIPFVETTDLVNTIPELDILYMTRIQKERFSDPIEYEKVKNSYILVNSMLKDSRKNLRVLHPLPRVNEISEDVDASPQAYYFEQALNGVYVRQAILCMILGVKS
jgi:aspartate carbamoyltransferase catalytic subunit